MIPVTKDGVVEVAVQNNELFNALVTHPKFNPQDPAASPKQLFWAADFVRRTYLEYILPLLPKDAWKQSSKIANRRLFDYHPSPAAEGTLFPESENEAWLMDDKNWPKNRDAKAKEMYTDSITRTMTICLMISDKQKGAMMMGGPFDWDANPKIEELVADIMKK